METKEEYRNRRITEIKERIKILENYINNSKDLKHNETGVGVSYLKRRNSRNKANKDYRISQFKSETEGLKRVLLEYENKAL